jgi:hypothetical protein
MPALVVGERFDKYDQVNERARCGCVTVARTDIEVLWALRID